MLASKSTVTNEWQFFRDGGKAGELIRSIDWELNPLGKPSQWPSALRTTVGMLLHSQHPMFLWWGQELIQFYNDAYAVSLGPDKQPAAMGQRGAECWQEIWPIIWPQIDDVMSRGISSWNEDHLVPIWRNNRIEDVYWTYGYSPVFDDAYAIGGTLVVCTETTAKVLNERRSSVLYALSEELHAAVNVSDIFETLNRVLSRFDVDCSYIWLTRYTSDDNDRKEWAIHLDATAQQQLTTYLAPYFKSSSNPGVCTETVVELPELHSTQLGATAFIVPIQPSTLGMQGLMVFGLNSRLKFDEAYRKYLLQIVARAEQELLRIDAESSAKNILESISDSFVSVNREWRFTYMNKQARTTLELQSREILGKVIWDEYPGLRTSEFETIFINAMNGKAGTATAYYPDHDRWYEIHAYPVDKGISIYFRNVTERLYAERALRESEAALRHADRNKDEFIAVLAHELRNPLAALSAASNLLSRASQRPDIAQKAHQALHHQVQHMARLLDDLLDVSRITHGRLELRKESLMHTQEHDAAVEATKHLIESKHHRLTIELPSEPILLNADQVRLTQILSNLLTNAANYTHEGGVINVHVEVQNGQAIIRIKDNGIGIAAESLPTIFERFSHPSSHTHRSVSGLGIGLSIVHGLARLHGGSVEARSAGLEQGSEFILRLPVAENQQPNTIMAAPYAQSDAVSHRILVADDNRDMANSWAGLLRLSGHEVQVAYDGKMALTIANGFRPHIAFLDIGMPYLNGYEVAQRVRETEWGKSVVLIAVTGWGQQNDKQTALRAGFDKHFTKPISTEIIEQLLTMVRSD